MAVVLKNERLAVTIEEPGKFYKGSRFDHTGNISQITLDGRWTFCSCELSPGFNPAKNGCGLYNEFGINIPVGYEDCPIGQQFPKIGTGLLTRMDDKPYNFFLPYEIKPFKTYLERDGDQIRFIVMPEDCRGYSVKMVKTISLKGNSLNIHYEIINTGIKRIRTNEYCHNFISINKSLIDSRYKLTVPVPVSDVSKMNEAVNTENAVVLNDRSVQFRFSPKKDFFYSPLAEFDSFKGEWMLADENNGITISETTDFIPELMNLWGSGHVISPEMFVRVDIMPGETQNWMRNYEFSYL